MSGTEAETEAVPGAEAAAAATGTGAAPEPDAAPEAAAATGAEAAVEAGAEAGTGRGSGAGEGRTGSRPWNDGLIARRAPSRVPSGTEGFPPPSGPSVPLPGRGQTAHEYGESGGNDPGSEGRGGPGRPGEHPAPYADRPQPHEGPHGGLHGLGSPGPGSLGLGSPGHAAAGTDARATPDRGGDGDSRYLPPPPAFHQTPSGALHQPPAQTRAERERDEEQDAAEETLRQRLGALRELVGLSRTRLDTEVLAEAGRVLDEAAARRGLPRAYTTVALAGATGSGKSSLFNALTGRELAKVGMCRPTTASPVSCTWEADGEGGADGLLDRLGIAPHARHRLREPSLGGLVLLDLPDHDSLAPGHREQVDRLLELVDAVVWVVDPEKYADAVLHERYLRRLAGHAEITFVVLNQKDRLTDDAVDAVLNDMRRLLDEDGMALGEHGEPGAAVLAASAQTEEGVGLLREELAEFVTARRAAVLRLTADLDGAMERLRPVYADPRAYAGGGPAGLTERVREDFEDRLAMAVGATAAGQAAERTWLRYAERAAGTPWARLSRWRGSRTDSGRGHGGSTGAGGDGASAAAVGNGGEVGQDGGVGGYGVAFGARSDRDGMLAGAAEDGEVRTATGESAACSRAARPVVAQAVRALADEAAAGLPEAWARNVHEAARRGAAGLPEALDGILEGAADPLDPPGTGAPGTPGDVRASAAHRRSQGPRSPMPRPPWRRAATMGQGLLLALQMLGTVWLVASVAEGGGGRATAASLALITCGAVGGPVLAWACRLAARGPARAYGEEEERRLRRLAAGCGRSRVLEPVAAELLRYREVREQYAIAAGTAASSPLRV